MAYTTIDDPSAYFHTQLYTGTGSELSVTNGANAGDFKPDWIWIKQRNAATDHGMFDSSRGVTKNLKTNTADAQSTEVQSVKTFNTDGFTLGTSGDYNGSSDTHVAWQWKANGATKTSFSESGNNPAGTHQANTTAGFSIVTHVGTGAVGTIAHGLSSAPEWILTKGLDDGHAWITAHKSLGFTKSTLFNTSDAFADGSEYNNTDPTSSVFTVKNQGGVNNDGQNYVNYLFHSVQGYSKFGKYTGNGNADGPFVYTGFKPAWIIQKNTADSTNWNIYDNKRSTFNTVDDILMSNASDAEGAVSGKSIDFLSNGFKLRGSDNETNDNGDVHIYMAFAESPFVSSEGVPTTAR